MPVYRLVRVMVFSRIPMRRPAGNPRTSPPAPTHRLSNRSLGEYAYQAIRSGIMFQLWHSGDLLSEQQIAEELQVSRTPVREALQSLGREGFVEILPARGTIVAGLSLDDLREIYELREALESEVVRLVAARAAAEDVAELYEIITRASRQLQVPDEPLRPGDDFPRIMARIEELIRSGSQLHKALARVARNRRIQEMLHTLEYATTRARLMHGSAGHSRDIWAEHLAIVKAIERRDADDAERLIRSHIRSQYEFLKRG